MVKVKANLGDLDHGLLGYRVTPNTTGETRAGFSALRRLIAAGQSHE